MKNKVSIFVDLIYSEDQLDEDAFIQNLNFPHIPRIGEEFSLAVPGNIKKLMARRNKKADWAIDGEIGYFKIISLEYCLDPNRNTTGIRIKATMDISNPDNPQDLFNEIVWFYRKLWE